MPLKATRRDSISNLTSFGASSLSCKQSQCRITLMPIRRYAMDWDGTTQRGWVKTQVWFKPFEDQISFFQRRFVLFQAFVWLSTSGFFQKLFAIKSRIIKSSKNRTNVKVFSPQLLGGMIPTFLLRRILSAIYCSPFGKSLVEFRLLMSVCEAWL